MSKALTIREVQQALLKAGFNPGPIDNAWGPKTRKALTDFQRSRGLIVDGLLGPQSYGALRIVLNPSIQSRSPSVVVTDADQALWYREASRLMGTKEIAGSKHNPVIMGWAQKLKLWFPSDETPWCGLFVAHCIRTALPDEAIPTNPLGARNWNSFGTALSQPAIGALLVFWRGSRNGWQGHVGFYAGESADGKVLRVLGGNQSNMVNVANLSRDRLLGIRWPKTALKPIGGRVVTANGGKLSTNEA